MAGLIELRRKLLGKNIFHRIFFLKGNSSTPQLSLKVDCCHCILLHLFLLDWIVNIWT